MWLDIKINCIYIYNQNYFFLIIIKINKKEFLGRRKRSFLCVAIEKVEIYIWRENTEAII